MTAVHVETAPTLRNYTREHVRSAAMATADEANAATWDEDYRFLSNAMIRMMRDQLDTINAANFDDEAGGRIFELLDAHFQ